MNILRNRWLIGTICAFLSIIIVISIWGYKKSVDITISVGLVTDEDDNIYLAIDKRVYKFNPFGKLLLTVKGDFGPFLNVAVDNNENIYVTDATNYQLKKFFSDGTRAFAIPLASEVRPIRGWNDAFGIAIDNDGNIWVCLVTRHCLQKFSPSGELLFQFPSEETQLEIRYPNEIAFDKEGNAYIANSRGYSIDVLDKNLEFLRSIPTKELDEGRYHCPTSICLDSEANIYVTVLDDFYCEGKVYKLDPWGKVLATFSPHDKNGNLLLPSDIAIGNGIVYSIDQDRILFSSIGISGEKVFLDPKSDLANVLFQKKLFMQIFQRAPILLVVLSSVILILIIILKLITLLTSPKDRVTKEVEKAHEEGHCFYQPVFGLPIRIAMRISLGAVILTSYGQLKMWLRMIISLPEGGFYTMHPGLLSTLSYNSEYTLPFIFASIAVFLFWRLRYPNCLKITGIFLLVFTSSQFSRMVDPLNIRWLPVIDWIVFYVSNLSTFWIFPATLATVILYFIVNKDAFWCRRGVIKVSSENIEFLSKKRRIVISWKEVKRVLEVKWPYRTIFVDGPSGRIGFDQFLEKYKEVTSELTFRLGEPKVLKDTSIKILTNCILIFFLIGPVIPLGLALHRDFFIRYFERKKPHVKVTSEQTSFNLQVSLPIEYHTDEKLFRITGYLICPKGATLNISINDEVKESKTYNTPFVNLSRIVALADGENRIEVSAADSDSNRMVSKGIIIYESNVSYQNIMPVPVAFVNEFLVGDIDEDETLEFFLIDTSNILSVLRWEDNTFQIIWQSIPLSHVPNSTYQMKKGYIPEFQRKGVLVKPGYQEKSYLLTYTVDSYTLQKVQLKTEILDEIPDTNGDGKAELLKKSREGTEILEEKDGELYSLLNIPEVYSDVLISDVNGNGIAEIYSFMPIYKAILVEEWKSGAHEPIQPDAPLQQIVAKLRGDLGYGYSLGFRLGSKNAIAGDFDGDGSRELLLMSMKGDSKFLVWQDGRYKCINTGLWERTPKGNLLAGDVNGDGKDEVICLSGIFGQSEGKFVLLDKWIDRISSSEGIEKEIPKKVAIADFDRDRICEVILCYNGKISLVKWQEERFFQMTLLIEPKNEK